MLCPTKETAMLHKPPLPLVIVALTLALALPVSAADPQSSGAELRMSPPAPQGALQQQVRAVETAFAKTMADRDHEAFSAFLADEAIFVSAATARGRDQVAAQWQRFFESPEAPFSWRPETVEVLDSGTLALSSGPVHDPAGQLIARFNSIWRQEAPGEWRIVFDKGERVCEEPATAPAAALEEERQAPDGNS